MSRKATLKELLAGVSGGGNDDFYRGPAKGSTATVRFLPPDEGPIGIWSFRYYGLGETPVRHFKNAPPHLVSKELKSLGEEIGKDHPHYSALVGWPKGQAPTGWAHKLSLSMTFLTNVAVGDKVQVWRMPRTVHGLLFDEELPAMMQQFGNTWNPFDPEKGHDFLVTRAEKGRPGKSSYTVRMVTTPSPVSVEGWEEGLKNLDEIENGNLADMTADAMLTALGGHLNDILASVNVAGFRSVEEIYHRAMGITALPTPAEAKSKRVHRGGGGAPDAKALYNG